MSMFEEPPKLVGRKKVSAENPARQFELAEIKDYYGDEEGRTESDCFGASFLGTLERNKESLTMAGETESGALRKILSEDRSGLEGYLMKVSLKNFVFQMNGAGRRHAIKFLTEAVTEDSVREEVLRITDSLKRIPQIEPMKPEELLLRRIFGETRDHESENRLFALIKRTREPKMPQELWVSILEKHREKYVERLRIFDEEVLPGLKERFMARAERFAGTDILPIPIERVKGIMDRLIIGIQDGLQSYFSDPLGSFNSDTNSALIASYLIGPAPRKDELIEHVFTHELFHALSGQTLLASTHSDGFDDEDGIESHKVVRVGTGMYRKLAWLNEGITEYLTSKFLEKDPIAYPEPLAFLRELMEEGKKPIPLRSFTEAYFEQYGKDESGTTIPRWRALRSKLNAVHGSDILKKISEKSKI